MKPPSLQFDAFAALENAFSLEHDVFAALTNATSSERNVVATAAIDFADCLDVSSTSTSRCVTRRAHEQEIEAGGKSHSIE